MTNVLRLFNILGPFILSILLVLFAAFDIVHDISRTEGYSHILAETVIFFIGFLLNIYFVHRAAFHINDLTQKNSLIDRSLQSSLLENANLKTEQQKLKDGVYNAVAQQMQKWELSPSETEIAFLVLKGLSNKEIANVRNTSESTVRLQCSSIYKKSQLNSRSELAAYFLEDLM
jgi:DNA-binding NarL/FixJ family response regulator